MSLFINRNVFFLAFAFALLTLGSTTAHAKAADCSPEGVCLGDHSFIFVKHKIFSGVVKALSEGKAVILTDESALSLSMPTSEVAVTRPGTCDPENPKICVGAPISWSTGKGETGNGTVAGYYKGFVFFQIDKSVISVPIKTLGPVASSEAELKKAAELANTAIEKVCTKEDASCSAAAAPAPAPAPAAPAEKKSAAEALFARVKAGETPDLKSYLVQWHPTKTPAKHAKNPWEDCRDPNYYGHPVKHDANSNIVPECRPDTLYSWGPIKKITDLEQSIGKGKWAPRPWFDGALYLAETPASSFGYGSEDASGGYAMRVKIKPDVEFKVLPLKQPFKCQLIPEEIAKKTVFVYVYDNVHKLPEGIKHSSGADFILCSSGPVQSWSYGTREFYDELSRDVSRILDPPAANDFFSYIRRPGATGEYEPKIWGLGSDKHPFTTEQLQNTLRNQLLLSGEEQGKVYFNPDVAGSDVEKRAEHFKSETHLWFTDQPVAPRAPAAK